MVVKDVQGSIMELVGADEKSVTGYQYDAYGNTTITGKQTTANELAYTGGVYDKTTEEYYLNARYYDPADGRFLTQDTYRGEETDSSTWNLYSYCGGNPVNYVDPSGHKLFPDARWIDIAESRASLEGRAWKNLKYNLKHDFRKGYANGQQTSKLRNMRYGIDIFKNNGCGVIASYNAAWAMGKKLWMSSIAYWYEMNNGLYFQGLFGTKLDKIEDFLDKNKIKYKRAGKPKYIKSYSDSKKAKKLAKKSKKMIIAYWNNKKDPREQVHTVYVDRDSRERYRAYNYNTGLSSPSRFEKFSELLEGGRLIVTYALK